MSQAPLVIAHRGDSAHRPENTLASFASAVELGASLVEFDVQLTADGHVVVLHDPEVGRTTNGKGDVRQMKLSDVRGLSAGYSERFGDEWAGERVPTLAEALALLHGRARVMIEIKEESVSNDAGGRRRGTCGRGDPTPGAGRSGGGHLVRPPRARPL